MKRSGSIQVVFKGTPEAKERNIVHEFNSRLQLLKKLWKIYKSGCDKVYVYFNKPLDKHKP